MRKLLLPVFLSLVTFSVSAQVSFEPLDIEELPQMNVPRRGHVVFATADGDIVAVGGHTTGFDLTSTAERLHEGEWIPIDISSPHDGASVTPLPDGRVLITGGFSSGWGIGQSTVTDVYNPETHSFSPTGSLNVSRALSNGVVTGIDNNVLISGNWYNSDNYFELWNGSTFTSIGQKYSPLHDPYMVSDGNGIVYVFGQIDNYGTINYPVIHKVNTVEMTVEELGNTGMEEYVLWNALSADPSTAVTADGEFIFLAMKDDDYYLLSFDPATETASQLTLLPGKVPDSDLKIDYRTGILVNKAANVAYVCGSYSSNGKTVVVIGSYSLSNGKLTVYHGGSYDFHPEWGNLALQPTTGDLIITGGSVSDNFDIIANAFRVRIPKGGEVTFKPLDYEELPNMNWARKTHGSFATADGDIVVVGGHTTGFYLTTTAERLHDGEWIPIAISSSHDGCSVTTLPDGRVLITGGFSGASGTGQTTVAHVYDPATQSFSLTGSLNVKRAYSCGVLTGIEDNVLISGNWYNSDDAFELWDGSTFTKFGSKNMPLHNPYMVSDGNGIVYVFGQWSNYGIDKGQAVYKVNTVEKTVETLFIDGLYEYNLWHRHGSFGIEPAAAVTANGEYVILAMKDDVEWHLLSFNPSDASFKELTQLPHILPDTEIKIDYRAGIIVNKATNEAYVCGSYPVNGKTALVVASFDLATGDLTIYHGGDFEYNPEVGSWALQPTTGNLILTGGSVSSNFDIVANALCVKIAGNTSGVANTVIDAVRKTGKWYMLDGRSMDTPPTRPGIYIHEGRKVVIK